jgi:ADP-ribose diphosphatase
VSEPENSTVAGKPRLSLLFVCTGNACRSQIAEGWARFLLKQSMLADQFDVQVTSAGLETHGLNSSAVKVMKEVGVDISVHTSDLLSEQQLEQTDWVITLCDHADQYCPNIPSRVKRLHWGLVDPAKVDVSEADELAPFRQTREEVKLLMQQWIAEQEVSVSCCAGFTSSDMHVSRDTVYQGFMQLQQVQVKHRLFEGGWSETFQRELLVRHQAVMVLLYDPGRDAVVLIEQFRIGALEDEHGPWLLEMVAGIVEPGESLEEVASRESLEEAGCEVLALERVTKVWTSPGGSSEQITLFCGKVDSSGVGGVHGLVEEHENICVRVVSYEVALQALAAGIIRDATSTIAMQWLQLNRDELRKRWNC